MKRVWSERSHLKIRHKHGPYMAAGTNASECEIGRPRLTGHQRLALVLLSYYPPFDLTQSTMQEVSRKRPHLGDSEPLPSKKRAVSVSCTTVPVNGTVLPTAVEDEEPRDQDSLEVNFMPFFFSRPTRFYTICCFFSAIPQGGYLPSHEALLARK